MLTTCSVLCTFNLQIYFSKCILICVLHTFLLICFIILETCHVFMSSKMLCHDNQILDFFSFSRCQGFERFFKSKILECALFLINVYLVVEGVVKYRTRLGRSIIIVCMSFIMTEKLFSHLGEPLFHCIERISLVYAWEKFSDESEGIPRQSLEEKFYFETRIGEKNSNLEESYK